MKEGTASYMMSFGATKACERLPNCQLEVFFVDDNANTTEVSHFGRDQSSRHMSS